MMATKPPVRKIRINNLARYVGVKHGSDWYEWVIYIDEDQKILNLIDSIEYLLHPSFPKPLRRSHDAARLFNLESSGWGEFSVLATVFFKDGTRLETTYYLDLSKGWDEGLFSGGDE